MELTNRQPLRASFPEVLDLPTLHLIDQIEIAMGKHRYQPDVWDFNPAACISRSGTEISIPVMRGNEKRKVRAVTPNHAELKQLAILKFWNNQEYDSGSIKLFETAFSDIDGQQVENIHFLERTGNPNTVANMVLLRNGDNQAAGIITGVLQQLHATPNAISVKHLVRDSSNRETVIRKTLKQGFVPPHLRDAFEAVAKLQERYVAETAHTNTLLHGCPGHYNIVPSITRQIYVATSFDPLWGPPSSDYAFVLTNPWDEETVNAPGRLLQQSKNIEKMHGPAQEELLQAVIIHTAMAACWTPLRNGQGNQPGAATLQYWERMMKTAADAAGFSLK